MSIKSWAVAILELELGVYVHVVRPFARTGKRPILYDYQLPSQSERLSSHHLGRILISFPGHAHWNSCSRGLGVSYTRALMHVFVAPPFCPLPSSASLSPCHLTRPLRLHNATGSGRSAYFNLSPKLRVHLCSRFEGVQKADEERHCRS
jgi:hypothetical protein